MSVKSVISLLEKAGEDATFRVPYNAVNTMEGFVELAQKDGYDFTVAELQQVLRENGDSFDSYGNPPKRSIWM